VAFGNDEIGFVEVVYPAKGVPDDFSLRPTFSKVQGLDGGEKVHHDRRTPQHELGAWLSQIRLSDLNEGDAKLPEGNSYLSGIGWRWLQP
jgi:hypothetical protein